VSLPTLASVRALNMKRGKPLPVWTVCGGCDQVIQFKFNHLNKKIESNQGYVELFKAWCRENAEIRSMKDRGII